MTTPIARAAFRLLTLIIAPLALASCGTSEREVDRAAREGILLIGNYGEPATLDPHLVTGVPENTILDALMETLTSFHPTDSRLAAPGLAESWEHSDDFTQWTFTLRKDATWTNGDPVVAGDMLYSWKRLLQPELAAQYADLIHPVRNARAYNFGEITDFSQVGIKAPDDHTIVIELDQPMPFFDILLITPALGPINQRAVEEHGTISDRRNSWATAENYVSNGPYRFKQWSENQRIILEKNPDYWDADNIALDEVHYFPIDNGKTEESLFMSGRLHVTSGVSPDKLPFYNENHPEWVFERPRLGNYYYYINVDRKPLDDVRVRQALSLAIDRKLIAEQVLKGAQLPAGGFVPPGMADYETSEALPFDPDRARQLLTEAGYPNGEGFPVHEILMNTLEDHRKIAEAIQEMWRKELNIGVGVYNQEWRVYLDSMDNNDFSMARAGLTYNGPDPYNKLYWMTTGGLFNRGNWSDPRFDALVKQSAELSDLGQRNTLLKQAETIMNTELPVIPLFWSIDTVLRDPRIVGMNPELTNGTSVKYLSFDLD